MGLVDGDADFDAFSPAVAYNPTAHEYLVVWRGDDVTVSEQEVYGQRLDAGTGAELGTNDFRISDVGPDGDPAFQAFNPAVVYNPTANEYLVVWDSDTDVDNEFEIFGQRIDATTGAELGTNDFRISDQGPDGVPSIVGGRFPSVAYNDLADEYLVVWTGEEVDGEAGVYAQRLDGSTAAEVGTNDFALSDIGPGTGGERPAVAYHPSANEYLVVWHSKVDLGCVVFPCEIEIFGQRLAGASAAEIGANDFRISHQGPDGSADFIATEVDVTYNSTVDEYLVVWQGTATVGFESEIFGQRLDLAGAEIGATDFQISDLGPDGDVDFAALQPSVTYNPFNDEYLVVWLGDDDRGTLVNGEIEMFGQFLDGSTGAEVGANDFRVSTMGTDGDPLLGVALALTGRAVAHNGADGYLVVWSADDDSGGLVDQEYEVYGIRFVPEPAAWLMLAAGSGLLAMLCRGGRRRRVL